MTEYINIISKEATTMPIALPVYIVGGLAIAGVLGTLFYYNKTNKYNRAVKGFAIFGGGGLVLMMLTMLICSIFFRMPTDSYRYGVTIDKDKITVAQYEKFIKQYHPTIVDDIYYFTAEELE